MINCSVVGIVFEAYSPLGTPGRPVVKENDPIVLKDATIKEIADKHNATSAQVEECSYFLFLIFGSSKKKIFFKSRQAVY